MYLLEIDSLLFGTVKEFSPVIRENLMPMPFTPDFSGYSVFRGRMNQDGYFVLPVHDQQLEGLKPYLPGVEWLGSFDDWWVFRDRKNGRPFTLTVYEVEGKDFRHWQETKQKMFEFYHCLIDQNNPAWQSFATTLPHWAGEPKSHSLPFVFADCEIFFRRSDCEV